MKILTNMMKWIGNIIISMTVLGLISGLVLLGYIYIISFWGAIPNRELDLHDLMNNIRGAGFWFIAICIAGKYYEEDSIPLIVQEDKCLTCGRGNLEEEEMRFNEYNELYCAKCWRFWVKEENE